MSAGFSWMRDQRLNLHRASQQNGAILSQRLRFFDIDHQLLEFVFSAIALSLVELPDRGRRRLLQLLQRWPALKKSARSGRMQVTEPLQCLRKIVLQRPAVNWLVKAVRSSTRRRRSSVSNCRLRVSTSSGTQTSRCWRCNIKISSSRSASMGSSLAPLG